MAMNPAMMAGGGQPQQPSPQTQIAPGNATTANPQKVQEVLKAVIQQTVDEQGYVDMNRLVQMWPQIAQQMGVNIPFQTVLQLIQQNPTMLEDIIVQMGLAGININGKRLSAEQILGSGTGAGGSMGMGG